MAVRHGTLRAGATLEELVPDFALTLEAANRSPATIDHYLVRLAHLAQVLGKVPVASISAGMLRRFLLAVKRAPSRRDGGTISDRYVEQHRKTLARFFGWAQAAGHIEQDPGAELASWRVDERELEVLSPLVVARLLEACAPTFEGRRDRAIIATLYGTGVRRRELVEISLGDVALEDEQLLVRGKNRRYRRIPTGRRLREDLGRYLADVRPRVLLGDSGRLFTDQCARMLMPNAVNIALRRVARRAGVAGQVSPHVLRHSFATAYLLNGGKRKALKIILGHTSDAMLDRYTHFVESDVRADHAAASPYERLAVPAGEGRYRGTDRRPDERAERDHRAEQPPAALLPLERRDPLLETDHANDPVAGDGRLDPHGAVMDLLDLERELAEVARRHAKRAPARPPRARARP